MLEVLFQRRSLDHRLLWKNYAVGNHLMDVLTSLFLAVFLILLNGFFVAAEFALVKVRPTQLESHIARGSRLAAMAKVCLDDLDSYLSATQLGITLASLGLGWIGEPVVEAMLHPLFESMGVPAPSALTIAAAVGFTIISFMHIVAGEVAPKSIAIAKPEIVSMYVAPVMRAFHTVFYPALVVLNASSNLLLRLIKIEPVKGHGMAMSSEELRKIAADSVEGGMITENQGTLLQNVFRFEDRITHEVMVPRNRVIAIDITMPVEEVLDRVMSRHDVDEEGERRWHRGHTRFPLYSGTLDEIVGVLHLKDLMVLLRERDQIDLKEIARAPNFVPETMPVHQLLGEFQRLRSHLAVVVDEHGGVAGIVTLEDTLEELVGEIQDEFDTERPPIEEIPGGFSVDGAHLLADFMLQLGLPPVDSEADTISGFVMEQLGRIPVEDDIINAEGGWAIEVVAMDRRRVERVHVIRQSTEVTAETLGERE